MELSKKRAQSVTNYLTSNGISSSRIETNWYGEEQPKFDNNTEQGRSKNRRVELAIVANEELKEEAKQKAQ
jgi:outer membrane protein OmpA-like peptidoglycan-associated protein